MQRIIGEALDERIQSLTSAVNGSLGANTKALIKMEKLKAKDDKEAIYDGMKEMIPGLESIADAFGFKKSFKKNPDKIMEYIGIADMITKGQASVHLEEIIARAQQFQNAGTAEKAATSSAPKNNKNRGYVHPYANEYR